MDDFKDLYNGELKRVEDAIIELDNALEALNSIQDDYNIPEPEWMKIVVKWIQDTTIELRDM